MEGGSTLFVGISAASVALLAISVSLGLPRLSAGMRLSLVVVSSVGEAFRFPPRAGMPNQPCRRYNEHNERVGTKQFKQRITFCLFTNVTHPVVLLVLLIANSLNHEYPL